MKRRWVYWGIAVLAFINCMIQSYNLGYRSAEGKYDEIIWKQRMEELRKPVVPKH